MHLVAKVNRAQMSPAEMPRKLRGWKARKKHAGKRCVHMQRVSSILEEIWPRKCTWAFGILNNQEDFEPKNRTKRKAITLKIRTVDPIVSRVRPSLTRPYILGNKRKNTKTLLPLSVIQLWFYFFTVEHDYLSLAVVCALYSLRTSDLKHYIYIYIYMCVCVCVCVCERL